MKQPEQLCLCAFTSVLICSSYMYDWCHMHIMSFSSYNGCKLNSHLTSSQEGFIAQLAEHHINIVEVMGLNPVEAFFLGFLYNCLSCFTSVKIIFTSILFFCTFQIFPSHYCWLTAASSHVDVLTTVYIPSYPPTPSAFHNSYSACALDA